MKNFEFLEGNRYYDRKFVNGDGTCYYFGKSDDGVIKVGIIQVPKQVEDLVWIYQEKNLYKNEETKNLKSKRHKIEVLQTVNAIWFYELLKEANASLEKRDKLRRIFV